MKVLQVLYAGWEMGGGETYVANLKRKLLSRNHDVRVFSSNNSPDKPHFSDYEFGEFSKGLLQKVACFWNPRSLVRLTAVVRDFRPDIVHIHSLDLQVTSSILLALRAVPTVMTVHSAVLFPAGSPWSLHRFATVSLEDASVQRVPYANYWYEDLRYRLTRRLLGSVRLFIAPSRYMESILQQEGFRPILQLYYGIDLPEFVPPNGGAGIVYVGRLVKDKGVGYLIRAMPEVLKKVPSSTLTIVGDGPEMSALTQVARDLNVSTAVHFVGWLPNRQIPPYYAASALVVIPSIHPEVLGLVAVEAMAVGRPVIGSNIGGIPEYLGDERAGYLAAPRDPHSIAEKVIAILSDSELTKRMSRNAREKAEQFSIERHTDRLEEAYLQILNAP